MEFLGFCCGCPVLFVAVGFLVGLWQKGHRRIAAACGAVLIALAGLAIYSTARHVVLEESLVVDACNGDAAGVRWRLSRGADPNAINDNGLDALGCAASNGRLEAARVLLEHGADPDKRFVDDVDSIWGKTPREWAVASKDPDMVRLFARFPKR